MAIPKHPGSHTRKLCTHFWSSLPQLVGTRVGNENFVLQVMGILCSNYQLLLLIMRCRKRWEATVPTPTAIVTNLLFQMAEPTGYLKGLAPISLSLSLSLWPCCMACGILVPRPDMETVPPAVEAQSLNQWTAREVPGICFFLPSFFPFSHFGNHIFKN